MFTSQSSELSRREFLARTGIAGMGLAAAAGGMMPPRFSHAAEPPVAEVAEVVRRIADVEIRAGVDAAIHKNLLSAATEIFYPGHFTISADGGAYGNDTTWPGLDSWQMSGAYLLLGRQRLAEDYFDFVRASQRKDGNIPFAIFDGKTQPGGCLGGLKTPDDIFTYTPPKREGLPESSQQPRSWIGLFKHWHPKDPLGALGPDCYLLTAAEIFDENRSLPWLRERLASLEAAAKFLLTQKSEKGLMGGAGFYVELPPRYQWDGVTQCYTIHAFRELARLFGAAGDAAKHSAWSAEADKLAEAFHAAFWREDHYGEYVHPERGLVDSHGLSDVNWAAVAFGIAVDRKLEALWPRLLKEKGFWWGDTPTQNVSNPLAYEKWEYDYPNLFVNTPLHDVAAMGRAWYLEAMACNRMHEYGRLKESVRKVCRAAKADGYWRERYHPQPDGTVKPAGAEKYCEYAAVLVRVVFGNPKVFQS
jgi:hypothetical protein